MGELWPVALFFSSACEININVKKNKKKKKHNENVTNIDQMEISQHPFHV